MNMDPKSRGGRYFQAINCLNSCTLALLTSLSALLPPILGTYLLKNSQLAE